MPDKPLMTLLPALSLDAPFSGAKSWVSAIDSPERADDFLQGYPSLYPRVRAVGLRKLDVFVRSLPNHAVLSPLVVTLQELHRKGGYDPQVIEALRQSLPPVKNTASLPLREMAPLFQAGPIRFYEGRTSPFPSLSHITEDDLAFFLAIPLQFLLSNEREDLWPQAVHEIDGTILGIGSLQNLNLAMAAPHVSAVGLIDRDPFVSLMNLLLLLLVPEMPNPQAYADQAVKLTDPTVESRIFTANIPRPYRGLFSSFIDIFRRSFWFITRKLKMLLKRYLAEPHSFLGNQKNYERASEMIRNGGVFFVYGDFWESDMSNIIGSAVERYDPIGAVYLSNMLDYDFAYRNAPRSYANLEYVLGGPNTQAEGRLLSTANVLNVQSLLNLRRLGPAFTYHATRLEEAVQILRASGTVKGFARHLQISRGLTTAGEPISTNPSQEVLEEDQEREEGEGVDEGTTDPLTRPERHSREPFRSSERTDRVAERTPVVLGTEAHPTDSGEDPKASDFGFTIIGTGSNQFTPGLAPSTQQEDVEFILGNAEVFDDHTAQLDVDRLSRQTTGGQAGIGDSATQSAIPDDWETTVLESIAQAERKGLTEVVHYLEFASDKEAIDLFADEKGLYQNLIESGYATFASQLKESDQKLSDHQILQINAALFVNAPAEVAALVETSLPADSMSPVGPSTTVFGATSHSVIRSTSVLRVVR